MKRLIDLMERAGALFLFAIMTLITVSAITRYLFNWPLPDGDSLGRLFLAVVVFWGFAAACLHDEHIQFDLIVESSPTAVRRALTALALVVTLAAVSVLCWMAATRVLDLSRTGEKTFDLGLPLWPFYAVAWLGLLAAVLALAWRLIGRSAQEPPGGG